MLIGARGSELCPVPCDPPRSSVKAPSPVAGKGLGGLLSDPKCNFRGAPYFRNFGPRGRPELSLGSMRPEMTRLDAP